MEVCPNFFKFKEKYIQDVDASSNTIEKSFILIETLYFYYSFSFIQNKKEYMNYNKDSFYIKSLSIYYIYVIIA